ncbi:uracil-DNA glycosylase family protein [Sphingomicrobium sp. XHP0239]|uniref:uracil-DNA glycosylase family protein n=1 Tax=Sphingomicrobium maritimum TaxID=3133972 RepID=UPI0031CC42DB
MKEFSKDVIEKAYEDQGHKLGWSFMGTPEEALRSAKVAIVGLNPGGGGDPSQYGRHWDSEKNTYFSERWGARDTYNPLQKQIHRWHELLGLAEDDVLCAQFVPFRSPTWDKLENREAAIETARKLWTWVLGISPAQLFITMGKMPAQYLAELMEAKWVARMSTGWGNASIDVYDSPDGKRILAMPHPSRYGIFGRDNGQSEDVEKLFKEAASFASMKR